MRYGIPVLADRVAPRCTFAESIILVTVEHGHITDRESVAFEGHTPVDFQRFFTDHPVDSLVCSGIDMETRNEFQAMGISIIDNVISSTDGIMQALHDQTLRPGYGFSQQNEEPDQVGNLSLIQPHKDQTVVIPSSNHGGTDRFMVDCLACNSRKCLSGMKCDITSKLHVKPPEKQFQAMLDSAADVVFEQERRLCRVAELVYFCLGMNYQKIGIAFCVDLFEPADILARVLRRFFNVYPVCCKVDGIKGTDSDEEYKKDQKIDDQFKFNCNPIGQVAILNRIDTELNVIVGLCMGVDCVFIRTSKAPVTTLFVKDKSLANNPIGAIYSDHYLREIEATATGKQ